MYPNNTPVFCGPQNYLELPGILRPEPALRAPNLLDPEVLALDVAVHELIAAESLVAHMAFKPEEPKIYCQFVR